jgi:cysteinyl-tRNA synthetase
MGLNMYNNLSRQKEAFVPWQSGQVFMYVCGVGRVRQ